MRSATLVSVASASGMRAFCLGAAQRHAAATGRHSVKDEDALTQAIITLASQYGRYGYRRITALLQRSGRKIGKDRVERIWRRKGMKGSQEAEAMRMAAA